MPSGSVKLQSIKKLGQENHSYERSDEGNAPFCRIHRAAEGVLFNTNDPSLAERVFISFLVD